MSIDKNDIRIGEVYIFPNGNRRVIDIVDEPIQRVIWEYADKQSKKGKKGGAVRIESFAEKAQRDYYNDPFYKDIVPFIFNHTNLHRQRAANILNKRMKLNDEIMPLKSVINELLNHGFVIEEDIEFSGRYLKKGKNIIKEKVLTKTGLNYAEYLLMFRSDSEQLTDRA